MSWGYKILLVYLVFVAGIAVMVFKSSTQKIDLVTTDYYAKELKYQDRIDAVKRTAALSAPVKYKLSNEQLIISLPVEFDAKEVTGSVLLYCPSDNKKDIQKDFTTAGRTITIYLPEITSGSHQLQVNWVANGQAYYFEEKLSL